MCLQSAKRIDDICVESNDDRILQCCVQFAAKCERLTWCCFIFCWFFFTEITSLITTLLTNVPVLRCVLLFVTRFCQICASLSESCYIVAPYWFCFFSDDTLCKALTLFSSVVYPAMGWMPIHCEAEKRNQFFMCASFLILDRNWWIFSRTLRKVSATLQFLLLPVMLF